MVIPFQLLPFEEVFIFTIILAFVMAILYRILTKPEVMRKIKNDVKYYKEEMSKAKKAGDKEKMNKFMSEQMRASQKMFGQSMKPMMASMLLFLVAIGWLANQYAEVLVAAPFSIPFIGSELNWFWLYLIIIIPSSTLFRKLLGVE